MNKLFLQLKKLFFLKIKFATTSLVATTVDVGLFYVLTSFFNMESVPATLIAASCGMVINFFMQKRFVFALKRGLYTAFTLSILVSLSGVALDVLIVWFLSRFPFFQVYVILPKLIAKGLIFFYNFYLKRYVFEGRFVE